jgi:hypothetical protein
MTLFLLSLPLRFFLPLRIIQRCNIFLCDEQLLHFIFYFPVFMIKLFFLLQYLRIFLAQFLYPRNLLQLQSIKSLLCCLVQRNFFPMLLKFPSKLYLGIQ